MYKNMYFIAVDFDDTLCRNGYPDITKGEFRYDVWEKIQLLIKDLKTESPNCECKLLLWTCRVDTIKGAYLTDAINFCAEHGVVFDAINENPFDDFYDGVKSPKLYADFYIDDKAISC